LAADGIKPEEKLRVYPELISKSVYVVGACLNRLKQLIRQSDDAFFSFI
jgi:hypothetical protein